MNNTTQKKSNEIENSTKSTFGTAKSTFGTAKSTFGTAKLIFKSSTFSSTKLNPQIIESSLLTLSYTGGGVQPNFSAVGINQQFSQSNAAKSAVGKKLSIVHYPLSIVTVFAVLLCLLFGGKAWGQCSALPLPLYEDFESVSVNEMPEGWTTATYQNSQWTFNGTNWDDVHVTSNKTVSIPFNADRKNLMVTPEISIDDISMCMVSFIVKGTWSYMNLLSLKIGVMSDPTDFGTFVEVQTASLMGISGFQPVQCSLSAYNGTGKYVAFYFEAPNYPNLEMDNIRIDFTDSWTSGEKTIGTGTSTTDLFPVYCGKPNNNFIFQSWTNMIYTADELGHTPMSINRIAFYYNSSTSLANGNYNTSFKIYLMQTTKNSFSTVSEVLPSQGMTLVYDGNYSMIQGWNEMPLFQTFDYDGTSNIIVAVYFYSFWNRDSYTYNFRYTSATNKCVYYRSGNNGTVTYETSVSAGTGGTSAVSSNRPNIKFIYCNENKCRPPKNFTATVDCPNVNLSWNALSQLASPKYTIYRDNTQIATNISATTYTDANVTSGDHTYKIMATSTSPSCTSSHATYKVCGVSCCNSLTPPTISATPGNRYVNLNLTPPTTTGVDHYILFYGVNDPNVSTANVWSKEVTLPVTLPYKVERLTNGQPYKFAITPVGSGSYCTDNPLSSTVSATPECNE